MAGSLYVVRTGAWALTANATKSLLLIPPGANSWFTATEVAVSIDDSAPKAGVGIELYAVTTLGSPAGTTFTPVLTRRGGGNVAQTGAALTQLTAEPTTVEVLKDWYVQPFGGLMVIQNPLGREPQSASGTTLRFGLRYVNPTGGSTANIRAYLEFEDS